MSLIVPMHMTLDLFNIYLSSISVSVSELMVTASQRHVIPLQGRPYEDDQVTVFITNH